MNATQPANELQKLLERFLDKPWRLLNLEYNPNIKMKNVLDNPDKSWSWYALSCNPGITMKDILANPDKPWDWKWVSRNPNVTMRDILNHPDKPWDWIDLSCNRFLYDETVRKRRLIQIKYRILRARNGRKFGIVIANRSLCSDLFDMMARA